MLLVIGGVVGKVGVKGFIGDCWKLVLERFLWICLIGGKFGFLLGIDGELVINDGGGGFICFRLLVCMKVWVGGELRDFCIFCCCKICFICCWCCGDCCRGFGGCIKL